MKNFVRTNFNLPKKLLLAPLFAGFGLALLIPLLSLFISPQKVYAETGTNILQQLGERCNNMERTDEQVVGRGSTAAGSASTLWGKCQVWQNTLHDALGCSDSMFYQKTDPDDPSAKLNDWYTNSEDYANCYAEAKKRVDLLAGNTCAVLVRDSDNWDKCQSAQNKLNDAVGCDSKMFQTRDDGKWIPKPNALSGCQERVASAGNVAIINTDGTSDQSPVTSGVGTAANTNRQLDCDAQFQNPLTWVICPVVDILAGAVDAIDNMITEQLEIDTKSIFCDSGTCQAYFKAWQSFRNIALGLMVIAGLVIVISQALGAEILDAYTIRKSMPRLLVAAIGITLSWPLMKFFVELTNDLGFGVRHLIYAPFTALDLNLDLNFGGSITNFIFGSLTVGGVAATGAAAAAFALFGGLGAILGYLGTALLAVFIAIFVLVLREIAIILLMLIAPIAIVAYILPNTQKVYNFWWESFSKALLMFPLIAAFIAAGRVFAAIALSRHDGNIGPLNQMIGFIAYFAPYFLIPLTFKFAGGFMRQLGGFVNDRGKGGFDRLRAYRDTRRKKGFQRMQAGNLYKGAPPGSRRERLNAAWQAGSLANPDEMGANPLRWRNKARALRERANIANALEGLDNHKAFAPIKGDDDTAQAALYGRATMEDARRYLESKNFSPDEVNRKLSHIELARKEMGEAAFRQAAILSAVTASTSYGDDPITGEHEGIGKLMSDIDMVAGDNAQVRAQLIGQVKQRAQSSGRMDLSAPFSDMYKATTEIGQATDRQAAIKAQTEKLTDTIVHVEGPGFLLGGKGRAVENFLPALQRRIKTASDNAIRVNRGEVVMVPDGKGGQRQLSIQEADREVKQVLASTAGLHDIASQISPEKAKLIADGVLGQNIPGTPQSVLQAINDFRSDDDFYQMRNDFAYRYGQEAEAQKQQQIRLSQELGKPTPGPTQNLNP